MKPYTDLVQNVLVNGHREVNDRTSVGTLSVFGGSMEFDLRHRFPVLQHKKTLWQTAFLEMLWFLRGDNNTKWLHEHNCKLWDAWADEDGELGPIYGVQWRSWGIPEHDPVRGTVIGGAYIDQVKSAINQIKVNPASRRVIVTGWNVSDLEDMALPPCHWAHQLNVEGDHLSMIVHMRSWDLMLGAPFNIAQYALLLHLYARGTGKIPHRLVFTYGNAHVYLNHLDGAREMLSRRPVQDDAWLGFNTNNTDIDGYTPNDFEVLGYAPMPFIKLEVAV